MNKNPLCSIIIPIYNVESWVEICIKSVLKQSVVDFELILVDDGSTDKSGYICDVFAKMDSRIIVIHKKNGGVSSARNEGLAYAMGKYIFFVDGDDILGTQYLYLLLTIIQEEQADIGIINYTRQLENLNADQNENKLIIKTAKEILTNILDGKSYDTYLWNKVFKKEIIDFYNLRFQENVAIWEDLLFVIEYLSKINKCVLSSKIQYYYRNRETSAVHKISIDKKEQKVNVCRLLRSLNIKNYKFITELNYIYLDCLLDYFFEKIKQKKIAYSEYREIRKEIQQISLNSTEKIYIIIKKFMCIIMKKIKIVKIHKNKN